MTEAQLRAEYEKEMALRDQYEAEMAKSEAPADMGSPYAPGSVREEAASAAAIPSELIGKAITPLVNLAEAPLISPIKAGVSEFSKGPYITGTAGEKAKLLFKSGQAAAEQLGRNIQAPFTAPAQAPSFGEVIGKELRTNVAPNLLIPEPVKKTAETVGGFAAEVAVPTGIGALSKVAGAATGGAGSLKGLLSSNKKLLKVVERNQAQKAINKIITKADYAAGMDPAKMADTLVAEQLTPYLRDPKKALEALDGKKIEKTIDIAPGLTERELVSESKGLIGTKSEAMKREITDLAKQNNINVSVPSFTVEQKLKDKTVLRDPLSGERYSPEIVASRAKIFDELLKPYKEEIVPGVPLDSVGVNPRLEVPPPVPMGRPDLFPSVKQTSLVQPPEFPPRPEFEGIQIPEILKAPEDINRMAGVPTTPSRYNIVKKTEPKPIAPVSEDGVIPKEAQASYKKELANWEKRQAKNDLEYNKAVEAADKADQARITGAEKVRESLAKEAIGKYDTAISEWEKGVAEVKKNHADALKKAGKYDEMVERSKIEYAADRLIERLKRDKSYKQEIMVKDLEFRDHLIESLNKKVFTAPNHWSLEDMMNLRTKLGKKLTSKEFHTDKVLPEYKQVVQQVYDALRDEIEGSLKGIPSNVKGFDGKPLDAARYYDLQSNAIHQMMNLKTLLRDEVIKGNKDPDMLAKLLALSSGGIAAAGVGIGSEMMGGNMSIPYYLAAPAAIAGSYTAVKKASPSLVAKSASRLGQFTDFAEKFPVLETAEAGAKSLRDQYVTSNPEQLQQEPQGGNYPKWLNTPPAFPQAFSGRSPQSLGITNMTPMQVAKMKLPRSSKGLLENKELVIAKLAMNNVPDDLIKTVSHALNNNPAAVEKLGGMVVTMFPALFEDSKYALFDGKLVNPQEATLVNQDVKKNEKLNSIQKAKIRSRVNDKGEYIGE
jgi:hypothetical protein